MASPAPTWPTWPSLGARLEAAKEVVAERHGWWYLCVQLLITCEVLAALLTVSLPAWTTSPWTILACTLSWTYLLAVWRGSSFLQPLQEPLLLLVPSHYSLYGLRRERLGSLAPRCFSLVRSLLLLFLCSVVWQPQATEQTECCAPGASRAARCLDWGTEGLPVWASCGSANPACYKHCLEDHQGKAIDKLGLGICNIWVTSCEIQAQPGQAYAFQFAQWAPIGGGYLEALLALVLSVGRHSCIWFISEDPQLAKRVLQRARALDEEVAAGGQQRRPAILLQALLYYVDTFLDVTVAVVYWIDAQRNFALAAAAVCFFSIVLQSCNGNPAVFAMEAWRSASRGLPTDRYVRTLAWQRRAKAPALMVQWYALPYCTHGNFAAVSVVLSLLSGLRSVVVALHQEIHLFVDISADEADNPRNHGGGSYRAMCAEATDEVQQAAMVSSL